MAKKFEGKNTLEVWDFRLSKGSPILYDDGEFWRVVIYANDAPDGERIVLDEHVTNVKTTGNPHDPKGIKACYEWLYSVRDKYSRDHIELRKPVTKMINEANAKASQINAEALAAEANGDTRLCYEKRGELQAHLTTANAEIKAATAVMHKQMAEANGAEAEGGAA